MAGRKPKPAELRIYEGKRGHRPIPKTVKPKADYPAMPEMDSVATEEWKRVVPELYKLGLLTNIDIVAMEGYCRTYSKYLKASEKADTTEEGLRWASKELQYLKELRLLMSEFGMTPSSRSRVTAKEEAISSDWEKLLSG